ncbi:MAG: CoA transferase [Candidatus Lambdaproteobacteria bacterium]|nr:CoA transferase [Candidatus Lambdaproteobacteria bacterium]
MTNQHVLEGVTVLDFTQYLAGPTSTRALAQMGATVIKVELPPVGDMSRLVPVIKDGRSAFYMQHNRGKQSLGLNVRDPRGREILRALIPKVDVLVENYSPGVIARHGLDWETVHALNPRLVMCSISGFGQQGPLSQMRGFDFVCAGYAGVLGMFGYPDRPPVSPPASVGDVATGMNAAAAIGGALYRALRTGEGQYIDTSLLDAYFNMNDAGVEMYSASGGRQLLTRSGSHHALLAPAGVFRGPGGDVVIFSISPAQWVGLCEAMGRPELAADPRFADHPSRIANLQAMVAAVEQWMEGQTSVEQVVALLQEHGVPCGPVLDMAQATEHPHVKARRMVHSLHDERLGEFKVPAPPFRFSGVPDPPALQAPVLGQHNEVILRTYLNYSPAQVRELAQAGVLLSGKV